MNHNLERCFHQPDAVGHCGANTDLPRQAFLAAGCLVTAIDMDSAKLSRLPKHDRLRGDAVDITNEAQLEKAFETAVSQFGLVSVCIAAAGKDLSYLHHHQSMADMPTDQWAETMRVNGQGTFLTARTWMRGVRQLANAQSRNLSLIVLGSEAGSMGVRTNADYSASKALMVGLVRSLAPDLVQLHPRARVNLLCPGPVDTPQFRRECSEDPQAKWTECESTVAQKAPIPISSVARACLFLASEVSYSDQEFLAMLIGLQVYAGSITGQSLPVDGGKSGKLHWLADGNPC